MNEQTCGDRRQALLGPSGREERAAGAYAELCRIDTLEDAYRDVTSAGWNDGARGPGTGFLASLSADLQAGTYHPVASERVGQGSHAAIRDEVVRTALTTLIRRRFTATGAGGKNSATAVQWAARTIERGLTRVYVETVAYSPAHEDRLIGELQRRLTEPAIIDLLKSMLASASEGSERQKLVPLLTEIAYLGIDQILEQARAIGRQGVVAHVEAARFGNRLIVLVDGDPHFDWVLPAAQGRIIDALSRFSFELNPADTQVVDLARGDRLRFLGFQLRASRGGNGATQVRWEQPDSAGTSKPLRAPKAPATGDEAKSARWQRFSGVLRCLIPSRRWFPRRQRGQGDNSRWSWVAALVTKTKGVSAGAAKFLTSDWHEMPAASLRLAQRLRSHWDLVFVLVCVVVLVPTTWELWRDVFAERVNAEGVPGLLSGQFVPSRDERPIAYHLYVPKAFQQGDGPFPLIVSLNGTLLGGLDTVVRERVRTDVGFDYLMCALDWQAEWWRPGNADGVMELLDYVMSRHHADPKRVYLIGHAHGARAVWHLAMRYPDRWASLVMISLTVLPEPSWLRPIPAWVFHGKRDKRVPAAKVRALVDALKKRRFDIKYTECSGDEKEVRRAVYQNEEVFKWFGEQQRH